MTEHPDAPPEGLLIKHALIASRLSQREAARRSGMSETRWRQLVSGYQVVSRSKVPVRSPDETLARMARAVGVTAEQLEEAGRGGAAAVLRDAETGPAAAAGARGAGGGAGTAPASRVDERWPLVHAVLRQARLGLTPPEDAALTELITAHLGRPVADGGDPAP